MRWGIRRMDYRVLPGLYALGDPDAASPVLVSANYKLSFDRLRRAAAALDAWILVLDTDGINVWCAAGKGTFGTDELVGRIAATSLVAVVDHRRLILPQLAAPGVAGHEVLRRSGFEVVWGPISSEDLPAFLAAGCVASPAMRRKRFPLRERAVLVPVELVTAVKVLVPVAAGVLLLSGMVHPRTFLSGLSGHGVTGVLAILAGLVAGAVLTPLLLPWLPGRAFAVKGVVAGLPLLLTVLLLRIGDPTTVAGRLEMAGWTLGGTALSGFLAMNFTGSSTYTSLSGVRREMRYAVPAEIAATAVGIVLWVASLWVA